MDSGAVCAKTDAVKRPKRGSQRKIMVLSDILCESGEVKPAIAPIEALVEYLVAGG